MTQRPITHYMKQFLKRLGGTRVPHIVLPLGLLMTAAACSGDSGLTGPSSVQTPGPETSEGKGSGITSTALIGEDFSNYSNTAALMSRVATHIGGSGSGQVIYGDGYNAKLAEIDNNVRYNGHQTLKYNQPSGTTNTPALWASLPRPLSKAWIRVKVRFSSRFTTFGTTPGSANAYKLLGWGWNGAEGRGTLEFTNTNQYTFYWNVARGGSPIANMAVKNGPNVTTEWTDGRWYEYIVFHEQTSPTTVRLRWWMAPDGETPQLRSDITGQMHSENAPQITRVMLGLNYNSKRTQAQSLWYGQWEVVDGSQHKNPFGVSGV